MSKFKYVYTAPTEEERKEIDSIRRQYMAEEKTEDKLARLRALDSIVKRTATALSISVGVIGCLLFGLGLAMVLEWSLLGGIPVSALGAIVMSIAYPLYRYALKRGKKRYGGEILRLSEELLNE